MTLEPRNVLLLVPLLLLASSQAWPAEGGEAPRIVRRIQLRAGLRHWDGCRPSVHSVAFSAGGKRLVSSSARVIKVWSTEDGSMLRESTEEDGWITALVLSADGAFTMSGGFARAEKRGGFVKQLSFDSGEVMRSFETEQAVSCLALHSDGKLVAAGFSERSGPAPGDAPDAPTQVRVWSLESGKEIHTLRGRRVGVASIAFSADGKELAAAAHCEGALKVWSLEEGALLHTLEENQEGITGIACSPDNKLIAAGSLDGFVTLWSAETGKATAAPSLADGEGRSTPRGPRPERRLQPQREDAGGGQLQDPLGCRRRGLVVGRDGKASKGIPR